ncbi:MAG: TetR/AcrR family transcriptional regulator [Myxococcota bacterium]
MEERSRRIVETAVALAEQGGFEAVRLRDVAAQAGVALGTLYRRFRSKEDLLVAALDQETEDLERRILQRPPKGATALERVVALFSVATRGLLRRPNLARALIKAAASGDPELALQVAGFHDRMERLMLVALRGGVAEATGGAAQPADESEQRVTDTLEAIWFSQLVGWSGGLQTQSSMIEGMRDSAQLLLRGAGLEK